MSDRHPLLVSGVGSMSAGWSSYLPVKPLSAGQAHRGDKTKSAIREHNIDTRSC